VIDAVVLDAGETVVDETRENGELRALFVGLCTLDIIQLVTHVPAANEKITALRQTVAAGGPVTNAAVAFAHLGGHATLLTGVGAHPLAEGIRADLQQAGVTLLDVAGGDTAPPPVSSIMVGTRTGERAVVSLNATGRALTPPAEVDELVTDSRIALIDAHHPELALAAASAARAHGRLCVLDGGSWKDRTRELLPYVDMALCSADFHPPSTSTADEALDYLLDHGVTWAAITNGSDPIVWAQPGRRSEIPVPEVTVVDTLGAGDIFHGAFAYAISAAGNIDSAAFTAALEHGSKVAAYACQFFGTRQWLRTSPDKEP
jgi:sugar/nucleoside kinase (ribokinase family)